MYGNESNIVVSKDQTEGDHLREDSNKFNTLKSKNTNDNLVKFLNVDEKRSRSMSVDSIPVVKFQGIEDKDSIYSEETEKKLPPIPDGGWGWVVVFATFLTSACSDGLAYSFGILHEQFIDYFGESQAKTSWIGSLFIAVPLISGPVMSALVEKYGCRKMTMIASVISTGGFLLASISNSVELLCVTFGVISGLAMGILYVTSVVAVAFWFDKRRTLAVSLASCGIGFGTVIYSPLTSALLQIYDWRGTVVILAGTILNMSVCGALMRDPDWVIIKDKREKKRKETKKLRKSSSVGSISIKSMGGESIVYSIDELKDKIKRGENPHDVFSILTTAVAESEELQATTQMNAELTHKRNNSAVDLPTFIDQDEQVSPEVMGKIQSNRELYNIIALNYPHVVLRRKSEVLFNASRLSIRDSSDSGIHPPSVSRISTISSSITIFEDDKHPNVYRDLNNNLVYAEDQNKINNIPTKDIEVNINLTYAENQNKHSHIHVKDILYRNLVVHRRALMNMPQHRLRASSLPDIYKSAGLFMSQKTENDKKWYDPVLKMLKKNFNLKLYTEFHFLMFNITSLLMSIWSIIPFFFLKSYMSDLEVRDDQVITVIGVASGVGIVGLGWLGDKPWFNVTKAYAVCLCICGVSVALYPFVIREYPLLLLVSVMFGLSFASSYSYTPAILMELVPIDYFTMGYGMILLSQGIGNLIGPPIGGLLFDVTESWDLTFYVGGAWLVVSGLCVGTIAYMKNFRICGRAPLLLEEEESKTQTGSDNV